MSNSQWHDDQATGERALREHKRRADLDSRLGDALRASGIKAAKMAAWFARHDNEIERRARERDKTSPAYVAWLLWGGDPGMAWAGKLKRQMDAADSDELTARARAGRS